MSLADLCIPAASKNSGLIFPVGPGTERSPTCTKLFMFLLVLFTLHISEISLFAATDAADSVNKASTTLWWVWPLALFVVTFLLGIVAVLGGVGGGTLFVPIISGFFPFHLDFVRGAGLLIALAGALAAGPRHLKRGMADLRLSIPVALIASSCAIAGAIAGFALPTNVIQLALGFSILAIVAIMLMARKSEYPEVKQADKLSTILRITGIYHEESTGHNINWKIHHTPQGLAAFILIGFLAGMFGIGAGWANVPALNLIMGAPLKVSIATSTFLLSITDTSAAWIYINNGAVLPIIAAPSIIGMMLGSMVGVRIFTRVRPVAMRYIVIIMLVLAGLRALLKGLGI